MMEWLLNNFQEKKRVELQNLRTFPYISKHIHRYINIHTRSNTYYCSVLMKNKKLKGWEIAITPCQHNEHFIEKLFQISRIHELNKLVNSSLQMQIIIKILGAVLIN